ncbi:MAG: AraC family transcriptional regulator [Bacteroidota bacterium]
MAIPTYDSLSSFAASVGHAAEDQAGVSVRRFEQLHPKPMVSPSFRTGYFSLVLIESGRGRYWLDGTEHATKPYTVYFTNPGHVKAFAIDEPVRGWILTFTERFLKAYSHADVFGTLPFLLAESAPPFYADADTYRALASLAEQIAREVERPSSVQHPLVAALLVALLLRFREAFWDDYDPRDEGNRASGIVQAFHRELEARVRALVGGDATFAPSLTDLADALALHPNYLATVIKAKTGQTVGTWTSRKLVAEAQGMLAGSRAPVKQVAHRLGFSELTAFSRFFKRETGQTPTAFRRAHASYPGGC